MSNELAREALEDPASVTVIVTGKNGYKVEHRIHGHERTALEFASSFDAEPMPDHLRSHEIWAPSWRRATFTVTQRFSYRAEDFIDVIAPGKSQLA